MNKYPKCNSCIKEDVCGIKKKMAYAYEQIMTANTTDENNSIHYARDNKDIDITVLCNKFSPKNGLGVTYREERK